MRGVESKLGGDLAMTLALISWLSDEAYEHARFWAWTWFLVAAFVMTASMTFHVIAVVRRRPPREAFAVLNAAISCASCIGMIWVAREWSYFFMDIALPLVWGWIGFALAAQIMIIITLVRIRRAGRRSGRR